MSLTRKGHSQLLKNCPLFFLVSLLILRTRSPFRKCMGFTLELYLLVAWILHVVISHTKPYKLQWLSENGELIANKQVLIAYIGKYKDEVLCDVVPMEATHVLLERLWQYDRNFLHDDLTNKISFHFQGHKVILKSLSPKEVNEDQIKMKQKRENEKK